MYELDKSCVPRWCSVNGRQFPVSVDVNCPYCTKLVNIKIDNISRDNTRKCMAGSGQCPACGKKISIWLIDAEQTSDENKQDESVLAMHPNPYKLRQPIAGSHLMPPPIRKAYQDTLDVFNARVWSATATQIRITLEGIIGKLLPSNKQKNDLANQIKKLQKEIDLSKPLITLSNALRKGGNIGAHFNLNKETNKETAEAMLDLIEYLMEYIYTLPEMIKILNDRLEKLDQQI